MQSAAIAALIVLGKLPKPDLAVIADTGRERKVVQFDRDVRQRDPHAWLTDQAVPISEADFDDANEVLFGRERGACESGMCFV